MTNIMLRKFELFGKLPEDDAKLIDDVIKKRRLIPSHKIISREGDSPSDVHAILSGFAYRYKTTVDGKRQIFAFLLPGDFCDQHVFILDRMDHTISTLSESVVVDIPRARMLEMSERPHIARAMWWSTLVDEATLREWIMNVGQRQADERVAHLFCELHCRMHAVGLVSDNKFSLPLTQDELADTVGLSPVHTNRTLQKLRDDGLITFKAKELEVLDVTRIYDFAGFVPNYLHLSGGKRDAATNVQMPGSS